MTWRPLPTGPVGPRPVRASLERLATRLGASADSLSVVFARWEEVVGAGVAEHCKPASLVDGVLLVEVDQPAWATQLRLMIPQLQARLAELAGEGAVGEIHIKVGRPRTDRGGRENRRGTTA